MRFLRISIFLINQFELCRFVIACVSSGEYLASCPISFWKHTKSFSNSALKTAEMRKNRQVCVRITSRCSSSVVSCRDSRMVLGCVIRYVVRNVPCCRLTGSKTFSDGSDAMRELSFRKSEPYSMENSGENMWIKMWISKEWVEKEDFENDG